MASQKLSIEQKKSYRQNLSLFIDPDPKNEALDPQIEVSGPKNKNISNQKLGLFMHRGGSIVLWPYLDIQKELEALD